MTALTLTNLANDIYVAADTVGRELTGFIPAVTTNTASTRAAVGDNVTAAFTAEAGALQNIGEGAMSVPEGIAQSVTGQTLNLTNAKAVQIPMGAEKEMQLRNAGHYETVYGDLIKQAMRKLTNAMEADLADAAKKGARTASAGAVNAKPFASDVDALALARNALVDAGCPDQDGQISAVMNNATSFGIRTADQLFNANTAGTTDVREQGILVNVHGISLRESGQISQHTSGAATGLDPDAEVTAGDTSFAFSGSDAGTLNEGDVISFAAADEKYVVGADTTGSGAATGVIQLNGSGAISTIAAGDEITLSGNYTPTSVFHRNALELAMRAPAVPSVGDAATDSIVVSDPHSGLVFEVRMYQGYRKSLIEVAAVWGVKAWKSDFITTILGN